MDVINMDGPIPMGGIFSAIEKVLQPRIRARVEEANSSEYGVNAVFVVCKSREEGEKRFDRFPLEYSGKRPVYCTAEGTVFD